MQMLTHETTLDDIFPKTEKKNYSTYIIWGKHSEGWSFPILIKLCLSGPTLAAAEINLARVGFVYSA